MNRAQLLLEINKLYREKDEKQAALDVVLDECRKINEKPLRNAEELARLSELYSEAKKLRHELRHINSEINRKFATKYKLEHRHLFEPISVDNDEKGLLGRISSKTEISSRIR